MTDTVRITFPEPELEPPSVEMQAECRFWETPGSSLAQAAAPISAVRLITERWETWGVQLCAAIAPDTDDASLDQVFSIEQDLLRRFPKIRFDLRVLRIGDTWDAKAVCNGAVVRLSRLAENPVA